MRIERDVVKIAFVGKGGSGKTTLAALFARYIAASGAPVLLFDADINQHAGAALGLPPEELATLPSLGGALEEIKEYLRGNNPRISSATAMVKTTPAGSGSRLLNVAGVNPLYDRFVSRADGVRLAVTGPFTEDDLGVACYHSKVGAVELMLNHMAEGADEYVVVDMTAGADSFASGLFTRFDMTFIVCEPTRRSVGVYRQYQEYASGYDVQVAVIGNKVEDEADVEFLRNHTGDNLAACFGRSAYVRAMEKGVVGPLDNLEVCNCEVLRHMRRVVDATEQDWARFQRLAIEFHLRNATAWANARVGEDLSRQVDPDFALGPSALDAMV